jgi:phosphotransferase system HPr (HPr) family protein
MKRIRLVVNHPVGLHLRPAALFVQTAGKFNSSIHVANLTKPSQPVNAKSIITVLTLGVNQGMEIEIVAEGDDEADAVQALQELVESDFDLD